MTLQTLRGEGARDRFRGGLFTPAKSGTQWRILCLLNGYPRSPMLKIVEVIHHDRCRMVSKKAVLKREEGIARPQNQCVFTPITEGLRGLAFFS
jgi:hypothetical protein